MELVVGAFTPSVLLAVARRAGQLDAHGLRVRETAVASSPAQFRSLLTGEIDVALTSPDNVIAYRFSPGNPLGTTADVRILSTVDRGMGLALYGRPGMTAAQLRGARVGVDVPTSGFALAMYALAESLGVSREEYELVTLGSTPKRLRALLDGECDATMLNAGNELVAEAAGSLPLARVSDVCAPYVGTVVSVAGDRVIEPGHHLATALHTAATGIVDGSLEDIAVEEACRVLDLSDELARRYVTRLRSGSDGLIPETAPDLAGLRTVVDLRRHYLPEVVDGVDVLARALDPSSGLVAAPR